MTVRLRPEAEADVSDAARWYEAQRSRLGSEFLDEVLRTLSSISEHPDLYPRVSGDVRRAVIRRFPFGVFYVMDESEVVVLAVMHGRRAPARWKSRA